MGDNLRKERRASDTPIKYLGIVITLIALLEGYKAIDEWQTPTQAEQSRAQAVVMANLDSSIRELNRRMDDTSSFNSRINDSLTDFGKSVSVTLANYGLRIESLEQGVKNHWMAPHPDNTARAMQNSEKNIEQDKKINELDFRVKRVEERP